jgi:tight adherence protein B
MGALVGLVLGLGLLLVVDARTSDRAHALPSSSRPPGALRARLDATGLEDLSVARVVVTCLGAGFAGLVVMLVVSGTPTVALAFGLLAAWLPIGAVGRRAARRRGLLVGCWPDAVDDLASAVRAGMSLPDAVSALAERGPEPLRPSFARFASDYRVTGSFSTCLDRLKADLSDPVGDRVVEALRLARDVGGSELGRLLRTLSAVLREDARTRAELNARQGWAVNAARLAVAAPWATLAFLSLRPGALSAYDSGAGVVVLGIAAGLSALAYVVMQRIGRLPVDERVLA